jgi:hypothetical protein
MHNFTRRRFITLGTAGGLTLLLGPSSCSITKKKLAADEIFSSVSPVDRAVTSVSGYSSGDDPLKPHEILWNIPGFVQSLPRWEASRAGGIQGCSHSRWGDQWIVQCVFFKGVCPLVLEQSRFFGGNSKGQSWEGIEYSTGAAYVVAPDKGSIIDQLFNDLDLYSLAREKKDEDLLAVGKDLIRDFWEGESQQGDQRLKRQCMMLRKYFLAMYDDESMYPEMPVRDEKGRKYVNELDRKHFLEHLERLVNDTLHPHLFALIEQYCWSSFAASSREISAAAGINFFAAEFSSLLAFPAGNASIAERLLYVLTGEGKDLSSFRNNSLVFDIQVNTTGVTVAYLKDGSVRCVRSKYAVLSCPKFVASKIMPNLEMSKKLQSVKSSTGHILWRMCY